MSTRIGDNHSSVFADEPDADVVRADHIARGFTLKMTDGYNYPFTNPRPGDFKREYLDDLAHLNRWLGKTTYTFSVMQHSLMVAEQMDEHEAIFGLLHDAEEVILGDLITPLKTWLSTREDFRTMWHALKTQNLYAIHARFGVKYPLGKSLARDLKLLDQRAGQTERAFLFKDSKLSLRDAPSPYLYPMEVDAVKKYYAVAFDRAIRKYREKYGVYIPPKTSEDIAKQQVYANQRKA